MGNLISFITGVVFAVGLVISGMTNPNVVTGFLNIFGEWNYALVFVMGGAVGTNLILFSLIKKREKPFSGAQFHWPTLKHVDQKLILGSALFGIGWGILGVCPGPGIVNLVTLETPFLIFVGSMVVGMFIFKLAFQGKKS